MYKLRMTKTYTRNGIPVKVYKPSMPPEQRRYIDARIKSDIIRLLTRNRGLDNIQRRR